MCKVEFAKIHLIDDLLTKDAFLAARKGKVVVAVEVEDAAVDALATKWGDALHCAAALAAESICGEGAIFARLAETDGCVFGRVIAANGKDKFGLVCATVTKI